MDVLSHHSSLVAQLKHVNVYLDELLVVDLLANFLIFSQIMDGAENFLSTGFSICCPPTFLKLALPSNLVAFRFVR